MNGRIVTGLVALQVAAMALVPTVGSSSTTNKASAAKAAASATSPPFTLPSSLDLHDGTVMKFGDLYFAYGTEYGCGFHWSVPKTPWCGFGVSQASSLSGPWSAVTRLFSPSEIDPWTHTSWTAECGGTGAGCFNPRMIQRSGWGYDDGVFILWFNSPADYPRSHANAYNAMGCNGPIGPCGPSAGPPYGSYHKPSLWVAAGNSDFTIAFQPTGNPVLFSTMPGQAINSEQLAGNGVNGNKTGVRNIAGLAEVESPGVYHDAGSGDFVLTYSDPHCGYCTGTGTGYAVATSLTGQFTRGGNGANLGFSTPANGRSVISSTSCGGQPRTSTVLDGQAYQGIDLWRGTLNETGAGVRYEPLTFLNPQNVPGDGKPFLAFDPFVCQ